MDIIGHLLDYVTSTEIFQIGDRKKKEDMNPIYHNFYIVYQT